MTTTTMSSEEQARWRYQDPDRKIRGYCNFVREESVRLMVTREGREIEVREERSDVKVREMYDKLADGTRGARLYSCSHLDEGEQPVAFACQDALGMLFHLAGDQLRGLAVPRRALFTLALQAIYDAGWEGPVR